jgi:outer membrane protein assembly factor BamB
MPVLQLVEGGKRRASRSAGLLETIDLLVEGTNLTARVAEVELCPLLCDLGAALSQLALVKSTRRSIRCFGADGSWEIGLERVGEHVLVSLFRSGPEPEVAVFEREVALGSLIEATLGAMARALSDPGHALDARALALAEAELQRASILDAPRPPPRRTVDVQPEGEARVRFSAEVALRAADSEAWSGTANLERSDLFALLVRGTVRICIGDRTLTFPERFVFLFAEGLLSLAAESLECWEQGRSFHRRADLSGILLGIRADSETQDDRAMPAAEPKPELWLSVGEPSPAKVTEARTFRLADPPGFVEACVHFGRALSRVFLRHDPAQKQNLRLSGFRQAVRVLDERLHEAERNDTKVNTAPEPYRAFAEPAETPIHRETAKLGFTPIWTASMAGIDLRATFLCGDHLVVGALRETACIDRRTGHFLWRRPSHKAASVVTTLGLARLLSDGSITLHDFATGEVMMTARVAPRVGGVMTGVAVSSPGLPRLLVLSEGKRHLSALDLGSGEVRWRHAARSGALFRLRRAGRLLIVVAGDATLTALDLASGEVVWRARDRLRFSAHVGLDHDSLFALAGDPDDPSRGPLRLYHLDPYAGLVRWVRDLPSGTRPLGAPLVTDRQVVVVTGERQGLGLLGLDRGSGEAMWSIRPGLLPITSAWLAVDDAVIINSEKGELLSVGTENGEVRWRQRFARGAPGDAPRRLEPILRSGALFVPQQQVEVVRPHDGALLGRVAAHIIPDLLRVDERCDVYVAEESGHLAAFRAGAKLSVVAPES